MSNAKDVIKALTPPPADIPKTLLEDAKMVEEIWDFLSKSLVTSLKKLYPEETP